MNESFREKYKLIEDERILIIRENLQLPVHEIKKIIKKKYPYTTNDDMEKLISDMNENRTISNCRKNMKEER